MKLNSEQLAYIKGFISKRGFTAIDLQMEIIDHVACRVENKLADNPTLGFEAAVTQTHNEFGVFGFSTLEEAMAKSLGRKYNKQFQLELKKWVSFPNVILLGGFAVLLFYTYLIFPAKPLIVVMGVFFAAVAIGIFVKYFRMQKRYKRLMAMQGAYGYVLLPTLALQVWLHLEKFTTPHWSWAILFSVFVLAYAFLFSGAIRIQQYAVGRCQAFERQFSAFTER